MLDAIDTEVQSKYAVFRKTFHVPNAWTSNSDINELVEHRYEVKQHGETYSFIEERLRRQGYADDNERMVHDYMHFMIEDLLTAEGTPFITEMDIAADPVLINLLNGKTPDLIVKSDPDRNRQKPLIVDVFVGKSDRDRDEKKAKYKTMKVTFDCGLITRENYNAELLAILSRDHVDYFHKQFHIFQAEYGYWRACLKFKKILFNDIENSPIIKLPEKPVSFETDRAKFARRLKIKAASLMDNEGI